MFWKETDYSSRICVTWVLWAILEKDDRGCLIPCVKSVTWGWGVGGWRETS